MSLLRLTDDRDLWPAVGNAAAVVNLLVAAMQWRLWRLALREWEGERDVDLSGWVGVSAAGVWLSVIGALAAALAALRVVNGSATADPAWWLALVGASAVILGTALAGVHRLHPWGPRGVPPHIRRNHTRVDPYANPTPPAEG